MIVLRVRIQNASENFKYLWLVSKPRHILHAIWIVKWTARQNGLGSFEGKALLQAPEQCLQSLLRFDMACLIKGWKLSRN
jgi:hypothetical protein